MPIPPPRGKYAAILERLMGAPPENAGLSRYVRQRIANRGKAASPAFLIGNGRSGTSMVIFRLARSWQVDLYNENHPAAFNRYNHLRPVPALRELIRRSPANVILFKPIKETFRACRFLSEFPAAKLLFMFRHYEPVASSARKRFYEQKAIRRGIPFESIQPPVDGWMSNDFAVFSSAPPPARSRERIRSCWSADLPLDSKIALHWVFQNGLYFDLGLDRDPQVLLIGYEDILARPAPVFQRISDFLEIRYSDSFIKGIRASNQPPPQLDLTPAVRNACEEMWSALQAGLP